MKNKYEYLKTSICLTLAISLVLPPPAFSDNLRATQLQDNPENHIRSGLEEALRRADPEPVASPASNSNRPITSTSPRFATGLEENYTEIVTNPSQHDPDHFTYIVRSFPVEGLLFLVGSGDLDEFSQAPALSATLIHKDGPEQVLGTLDPVGVILRVPGENILWASPFDTATRFTYDYIQRIRVARESKGLLSPRELIRASHKFEQKGSRYNELFIEGRGPMGRPIEIIGVFVKGNQNTDVVRPLREWAEQRGLPVIAMPSSSSDLSNNPLSFIVATGWSSTPEAGPYVLPRIELPDLAMPIEQQLKALQKLVGGASSSSIVPRLEQIDSSTAKEVIDQSITRARSQQPVVKILEKQGAGYALKRVTYQDPKQIWQIDLAGGEIVSELPKKANQVEEVHINEILALLDRATQVRRIRWVSTQEAAGRAGLEEALRRSDHEEPLSPKITKPPAVDGGFWALRGQDGSAAESKAVPKLLLASSPSPKAAGIEEITGPLVKLLHRLVFDGGWGMIWGIGQREREARRLIDQNASSFGDLLSLYRSFEDLPKPQKGSPLPEGGTVDVPRMILEKLRQGSWKGNEKRVSELVRLASEHGRSREARITEANAELSRLSPNQLNHLLDLYTEHPENEWSRFSRNLDFSIADLIQQKIQPLSRLKKWKTSVQVEHLDGTPYLPPEYVSARKKYWFGLLFQVSSYAVGVPFLLGFPFLLEVMSWGFAHLVVALVEAVGLAANRQPLEGHFMYSDEGWSYLYSLPKTSLIAALLAWLYYDTRFSYPNRNEMILAHEARSGSPPYEVARVTVQIPGEASKRKVTVEVRRRMDLQPSDGFEQDVSIGTDNDRQKKRLLSRPDFTAAVANAVAEYVAEQGHPPQTYPLEMKFNPHAVVPLQLNDDIDQEQPRETTRARFFEELTKQMDKLSSTVSSTSAPSGSSGNKSATPQSSLPREDKGTSIKDLILADLPWELLSEEGLVLFAQMVAQFLNDLQSSSGQAGQEGKPLSNDQKNALQREILEMFFRASRMGLSRKEKAGNASDSLTTDLSEGNRSRMIRHNGKEYEVRESLIRSGALRFLDLYDPAGGGLILRITYDIEPVAFSRMAWVHVRAIVRDEEKTDIGLTRDLLRWMVNDLRAVFPEGLRLDLPDSSVSGESETLDSAGLMANADLHGVEVLPARPAVEVEGAGPRVGVVQEAVSIDRMRDVFGSEAVDETGRRRTVTGLDGRPISLEMAFRVEVGSSDSRIPVYFAHQAFSENGEPLSPDGDLGGFAAADGMVILVDSVARLAEETIKRLDRFSGPPVTLEQRLLEEAYPNRDLNHPDFVRGVIRDVQEETVLHEADHYLRIRRSEVGQPVYEEISAYLAPVRFGSNPLAQLYFLLKSNPGGEPHAIAVAWIKQGLTEQLSQGKSNRFSHPTYPPVWIAVAAHPAKTVLGSVGALYSHVGLANSPERMQPFIVADLNAQPAAPVQQPASGLEEKGVIAGPAITTGTALREALVGSPRVTLPVDIADQQPVLIFTPDGLPKLLLAAAFVSQNSERPLLVEALANDAAHQERVQTELEELGLKGIRVHDVQAEFGGNIGEAVTQLQMGYWQSGKETLVVTALSGLEEIARFLGVPGVESELRGVEAVVDRSQAVWS